MAISLRKITMPHTSIKIGVTYDKLNFERGTKIIFKRGLLKSISCIGTQQKGIIDYRKLLACILLKLLRRSGLQIDITHFGDVIIGIKFQLGLDTQLTNLKSVFGSNWANFIVFYFYGVMVAH